MLHVPPPRWGANLSTYLAKIYHPNSHLQCSWIYWKVTKGFIYMHLGAWHHTSEIYLRNGLLTKQILSHVFKDYLFHPQFSWNSSRPSRVHYGVIFEFQIGSGVVLDQTLFFFCFSNFWVKYIPVLFTPLLIFIYHIY